MRSRKLIKSWLQRCPNCEVFYENRFGEVNERESYMRKAAEFGGHVLLINCVDEPDAFSAPALGGCYHYAGGEIRDEQPLGSEGMLLVSI